MDPSSTCRGSRRAHAGAAARSEDVAAPAGTLRTGPNIWLPEQGVGLNERGIGTWSLALDSHACAEGSRMARCATTPCRIYASDERCGIGDKVEHAAAEYHLA